MKVYEATKKVVGAPKLSQENLHSLKRYYHFTLCYSSAKESNISVSLKPDFNTSTSRDYEVPHSLLQYMD